VENGEPGLKIIRKIKKQHRKEGKMNFLLSGFLYKKENWLRSSPNQIKTEEKERRGDNEER